jgi:hypothetical protein
MSDAIGRQLSGVHRTYCQRSRKGSLIGERIIGVIYFQE